jgi:predicted ATP-grasp superfamily ATP-dependent carboligase
VISSELERWLKPRGQTPLAIVFGCSANGLSFARSLGRRGISVLLLDSERLLGAFTRYSKFVLLPPVDQSPEDWLALIEFVGAHAKHPPFLFTTTDAHTLFVAQHEQRLRRSFRFIIPDLETVEQILNKRSQYQIASGLLVPIPATLFPDRIEEVRYLVQRLDFPCLLEAIRFPYGASAWRNANLWS